MTGRELLYYCRAAIGGEIEHNEWRAFAFPKREKAGREMSDGTKKSDKILAALERVTKLLEDLLILEACRAGIKHQGIRALLRVEMRRVTRIGRHVKERK